MKIAFDIGGVLSKHSQIRDLFSVLITTVNLTEIKVFIITDMPIEKAEAMLKLNNIWHEGIVFSADYTTHGENCKKVLCEELGIDILIDDSINYLSNGNFVRLLVMPNSNLPYYSNDWKTDGSEGNFGRK